MQTIEHANNDQNCQHHLKFTYDLRDFPGRNYQHFLVKRNKKKRQICQHPMHAQMCDGVVGIQE